MQVEIRLPNGYNIMGGYKMKKNLSRILSVFLIVLLLASLPMAQAFAAYDCKCGTYSELVLAQFNGKDDNNIVDKASISSGSCPGMSLKLSADATQILLSGTPTKPGTYKLTVAFEMRDGQPGSTDATVNVAAVQPTVQASASTTAPKKDDNFQLKLSLTGGAPYEVTLYTNTSNSTSGGAAGTTWTFESDSQNVTVGTKGMESSVQTYYYYLTVKNSAGTATSNVVAVTNPSYTTVTPSPSPSPAGEIKITKQPTGETVEEGGRAVFIARAENAASFAAEPMADMMQSMMTNTVTARPTGSATCPLPKSANAAVVAPQRMYPQQTNERRRPTRSDHAALKNVASAAVMALADTVALVAQPAAVMFF